MNALDQTRLNFDSDAVLALNFALAFVMFGVALSIRFADFRRVVTDPRAMFTGLLSQFLLLPAMTFLLIELLKPPPSIALGMILVAACPGGVISNFFASLARGDVALSVSMSAVSTVAAIVTTPLNLAFWAGLSSQTAPIVRAVALDPMQIVTTIVFVLGVPLLIGVYVGNRYTRIADRLQKPARQLSAAFLALFVAVTLASNWETFELHATAVAGLVAAHNAVALALGYFAARLTGLPEMQRRAVAIEVGIQNSGLGLLLVFDFFGGLGGTAIVVAWWGVWHLIAGSVLALVWSRRGASQEIATLG